MVIIGINIFAFNNLFLIYHKVLSLTFLIDTFLDNWID